MAIRYSADFLLHLRESPLCVRPNNLPPVEEWMGAPAEQNRNQGTKTGNDRPRAGDSSLLDQTNRRSLDRHAPRPSANSDDMVFGPPRMAFSSARGNKVLENEKTSRDADAQGRVGIRTRGDAEGDRFRDGRSNPLRRRGDGEQDGEGWNTVKPRKSFGAEGAERFHGKMGGNFRDEKNGSKDGNKEEREAVRERPGRAIEILMRDLDSKRPATWIDGNKEEREVARDRQGRAIDILTRDLDLSDAEARPRNAPGRNRGDNWRASGAGEAPPPAPEKKNRDRTKSWRDRERDVAEPAEDRNAGKANDRRWGRERDQRQEREPEWLDEPAEAREAHTQQDFQKWMEQMKKAKGASSTSNSKAAAEPIAEAARPSLLTSSVETGPDKFFLAFGGGSAATDVTSPGESKDSVAKAKASGKSSRFTSFFSQPQGDPKPRADLSTPLTEPPANESTAAAGSATGPLGPGLGALFGLAGGGGGASGTLGAPPEEERQAFKQLLAKLQRASMNTPPPGPSSSANPPASNAPTDLTMMTKKKNTVVSPDPQQQYTGVSGEAGPAHRPSQHLQPEILAPRPQQQPARPDQLLQDLVGQHQRASSQGSTSRPEPHSARNNSNTEFLMNLMRMAPESQRRDHVRVPSQPQLGPQVQKHPHIPSYNDREQPEFGGRENRNNMRPQPPPGFAMDEPFRNIDRESRQNPPTQILQRPPPPGLDQMPPAWMAGAAQMPPPPQQRGPMLPPPGLIGGLAGGPGGVGRNMHMPPMFPPNFPPGAMLPPDAMVGMPPRDMPPPPLPPPGFFNGPPHGFLPPGLGGFNGPPPGPNGFVGHPFDVRGPPPSAGNNGRGVNYGRL
ncbi:hypothetical protein E4U09_006891 [Claviceps aff. purpurea]|uniref:Uncharacterized protein n=1 Tax=Claviceps aff. purpurea TaxID=1967640 RepID=A0A9P7QK60_9HYPO|nr:hypothetical protein E4U09_006891 [Claviceps aff. purpurea]